MTPDQSAALLSSLDAAFAEISVRQVKPVNFDSIVDPDTSRQDAFERECEEAERRMHNMLLDHGRKCLKVDDYSPTEDSVSGAIKLSLTLDLEVCMNDPSKAVEALLLLAEGLKTL